MSTKSLDITFVPIVDLDKVRAIVGVQQCGPSSISVADIDRMAASEWQLVYASYLIDSKSQINLGPGATAPFILEVKSASPGTFHLAVAYVIEDVIVHLGRAQTVQVQPTQPQLEECRELGISPDKCNDIAVFQTRELQHRDKMVAQEQQEQLDTAMNMIGIGAAIAGIMAFVMLRKKIMLPKCSKAMLAIIILLVSDSATMDEKIAYHEEMEQISTQAGDFTKAEHHRKMQEIYRTMKEAAMTKA